LGSKEIFKGMGKGGNKDAIGENMAATRSNRVATGKKISATRVLVVLEEYEQYYIRAP